MVEREVETSRLSISFAPNAEAELAEPAFVGYLAQTIKAWSAASQQLVGATQLTQAYASALTRVHHLRPQVQGSKGLPISELYFERDGGRRVRQMIHSAHAASETLTVPFLPEGETIHAETEEELEEARKHAIEKLVGLERLIVFAFAVGSDTLEAELLWQAGPETVAALTEPGASDADLEIREGFAALSIPQAALRPAATISFPASMVAEHGATDNLAEVVKAVARA